MSFTQKKIWYFEKPGEANTADAARFAIERAKELNLKTVLVASTSGKTAEMFFAAMKGSGLNLIVVSHVMGFVKPGEWEFSKESADRLRGQGVKIVTGTHALRTGTCALPLTQDWRRITFRRGRRIPQAHGCRRAQSWG